MWYAASTMQPMTWQTFGLLVLAAMSATALIIMIFLAILHFSPAERQRRKENRRDHSNRRRF